MATTPVSLAAFVPPITGLFGRVSAVEMRAYESLPLGEVDRNLRPLALQLVTEAQDLSKRVQCACESAPPEPVADLDGQPFELMLDTAIAHHGGSWSTVADVAFLGALELRQRTERLRAGTDAGAGVLGLLVECDSALRRAGKVLMALDRSIAMAERLPPTVDYTSELDRSLMVRKAYVRVRNALRAMPPPTTAPALVANMRGAGTMIAKFIGWDVYPHVRVGDRLQFREVQSRILDWLRPDNRSLQAGTRLWQDLVGFVSMLMNVNRRQELMEHDLLALGRAREALAQSGAGALPGVLAWLEPVRGLDDELDTAVEAADAAGIQQALARLWRRTQPDPSALGGEI